MNVSKTKFMAYNTNETPTLCTNEGSHLDQVKDFQYLGSWVDESEKDFKIRKALAWKGYTKMRTLWNSNLPVSILKDKILFSCRTEHFYMVLKDGLSQTN